MQQDSFGIDHQFIARLNRGSFRFLCNRYWRIETSGLEHVPRQGPALLVGAHRGFVPFDAMMALHLVARAAGRVPRFLVHPGLLKFRPMARFLSRLGGVPACRENAERILENGELLGVFPEGVKGAFTPVRDAYRLQSFGRHTFIRLSRQYRAPMIPFVTLGSAEVLPIFTTIDSPRWRHYSKWPCIPVSTFPFLPLPLPTKWHMKFLPPRVLGQNEAASHATFRNAADEVKREMQQAIDEMLRQRRSLFYGSVFPKA
jgi:1-acyl-sn-glycerol-3-phosphate acyltransferase